MGEGHALIIMSAGVLPVTEEHHCGAEFCAASRGSVQGAAEVLVASAAMGLLHHVHGTMEVRRGGCPARFNRTATWDEAGDVVAVSFRC